MWVGGLENAVVKHLLYYIDRCQLIPATQYGTRAFPCTLDAGLALSHDVEFGHRSNQCGPVRSTPI
jgi:hypothetical protein